MNIRHFGAAGRSVLGRRHGLSGGACLCSQPSGPPQNTNHAHRCLNKLSLHPGQTRSLSGLRGASAHLRLFQYAWQTHYFFLAAALVKQSLSACKVTVSLETLYRVLLPAMGFATKDIFTVALLY